VTALAPQGAQPLLRAAGGSERLGLPVSSAAATLSAGDVERPRVSAADVFGLIAAVTVEILRGGVVDVPSALFAAGALGALLQFTIL